MKIGFYGAAQTVTGSQHMITVNGKTILLDCRMYQGKRNEAIEINKNFPFDVSKIDCLILSHAHMDHSGNIPNLVKHGFNKTIYATPATVDLCKIMLKDSAHLQQNDLIWVNKIRATQKLPPAEPLYTMEDVEKCLDLFEAVDFDTTFSVGTGIDVRFHNAGHILGSASIMLDIVENGVSKRIGYTGDIGRSNMPIVHDPNQLRDLDALIMESTYGDRLHSEYDDVEEQLAQIITNAAKTGGKIIIPAFAIGRTQLMVYILHKLFDENRIPEIPIYVDSPMAVHATEIYRKHFEELDREAERIFIQNHQDPFSFRRLTYVESSEESKALNNLKFPHVIISASGMAEGGRILHHLRNGIGDHKTTILFVGYAASNTLARKIMDGNEVVKIFGEEHKVRAKLVILDAFSAHADKHELLKYVSTNPPERLKNIFIVHGEADQMTPFKNALRSKGYPLVTIPATGEVYEV